MSSTNRAALFSFLRVLAVALASAILPFLTGPTDDVPLRAVLTAIASAFLLTVINYFRPGETRFGVTDKHDGLHGDAARSTLGTIGMVLLIVGAVLAVLHLLGVLLTSLIGALLVAGFGLVLLLVDGSSRR